MSYTAHSAVYPGSNKPPSAVAVRRAFLPPLFGQFASTTRDALRKKYQIGHAVSVSARSRYNIVQEYGARIDGSLSVPTVTGYVATTAATKSFEVTSAANTDPTVGDSVTATALELAPGLKLSLTGATRDGTYGYSRPVGSVYSTFVADGFNVSARALTDTETHRVEVTAATGLYNGPTDTITVGGQILAKATDPTSPAVENFSVGAEYATADFVATIVTNDNANALSALYTHRVAPSTLLATEFTAPISSLSQFTSAQRTLTVGTVHSLDNTTTLRGRITVPDGAAQFHIERSLLGVARGTVGLSLAANIGKLAVGVIDKWGINIQLGEY